ncbi:MAG TPA: class I SAM-dependent methyltransferase [Jatrophihabitans sp.]|nr:class I SAM-dependent methyltransferase [Jatrophihabitans sp.]
MTTTQGFDRGWSLYQRHLAEPVSGTFELLGRQWDLADGVFAPNLTPVTQTFTEWLPFPVGGSFLEVGCGAGVTAVSAALAGCARVAALDISAAAVANTEQNAARHGVADRVQVLHSDLFDALPAGSTFDLIFWNSNFAEPPDGFTNDTDLQHAFFDPGYAAHDRYLAEGPDRLAPDGRLLLGFSDIGSRQRLEDAAAARGLRLDLLESRDGRPAAPVVFQLLEISRRDA